ncbi:hypothetical protein DFH09DRAFT_1098833 [Mycena vulgaris]|nr:hypothetical protein DFH09DRAFT_1098833 [Mycena vulgaris]
MTGWASLSTGIEHNPTRKTGGVKPGFDGEKGRRIRRKGKSCTVWPSCLIALRSFQRRVRLGYASEIPMLSAQREPAGNGKTASAYNPARFCIRIIVSGSIIDGRRQRKILMLLTDGQRRPRGFLGREELIQRGDFERRALDGEVACEVGVQIGAPSTVHRGPSRAIACHRVPHAANAVRAFSSHSDVARPRAGDGSRWLTMDRQRGADLYHISAK